MKKAISVMLILVLIALAAPVRAEEAAGVYDCSRYGFTLTLPEDITPLQGFLLIQGDELGDGAHYAQVNYVAMTRAEYDLLSARSDLTEEELDDARSRVAWMGIVMALPGGGGLEALNRYFSNPLVEDEVLELGEADGYTFYRIGLPDAAFPEDLDAAYQMEYARLSEDLDDILTGASFCEPLGPYGALIGKTLTFETTDTEGNVITSGELFGRHEITMLNVWTSWCIYCVRELETLEEINGRLNARDCAVVGLLMDSEDPGALDTAKGLMAEHGVTYTNIRAFEGAQDMLPVSAFPTTFFVDRQGRIMTGPIEGAYTDRYEQAVLDLLAEKGAAAPAAQANSAGAYRVAVTDEEGKGVPGAAVQLCSDALCMLATTDEGGVAVFDAAEGTYTAHILKAPEGFAADDAEYPMLDVYSDLTIVLRRE